MNKARAFNPFLRAKADNLLQLIAEVQTQLEGYEAFHQTRKRVRRAADQVTFERTVEAILCDLCAVVLEPTDHDSVHLPLSNKTLRTKSRYKGTALGKTLPDILKIMAAPEMDFVGVERGHSTFKNVGEELKLAFAGGQQTIVQPGSKLLSRIERFGITRDDIGPAPEEEVIILRAPKHHPNSVAEFEEYEDDEATLALRDQMIAINAWLEGADICCSHPDVNPAHRRLRRIFNNADFAQGGRLFGGFWQKMSSDERLEHILIEDDCCVELDYGQMSLMILYGLTGHTPPEGDLYDLSGEGIPVTYRKGIKKVIQAVINSPELPRRLPKGSRKHIPSRYSIKDLLHAVERKHPAIFPKMTSGIGMHLFRKEADILVDVLTVLKAKGVVALPIHDAVIVMDEHQEVARKVMIEVFKEHMGLTPQVTLG
ncbi:hypothetical protein PM03_09815 [Thalassobacter stenotrophicus]|uniref:hypothetical protein n=1 Tax=Thalassobacter stenotrophicus TaxID=266809 RepID=UPI00051FA66F|nr:hypothetical protein [Thalassobacter stenotrophicus]KGK79765.1 hypothetical protein PM03_09815 [Thalassobacter stenotrophicus]